MIHDVKRQVEKKSKIEYYQFDWTDNGITIFRFKWYIKPKEGWHLFYPQSLNSWTRKWQHILQLSQEKRNQLIAECEGRWGIRPAHPKEGLQAIVKPLVKMVYYDPTFGPKWVVYEKHKELIEKNLDLWTSKGMLIEER